jgi:hypothetical protein
MGGASYKLVDYCERLGFLHRDQFFSYLVCERNRSLSIGYLRAFLPAGRKQVVGAALTAMLILIVGFGGSRSNLFVGFLL